MFYIVLQLITDELSEMIEGYCNLGFPFTSREVRDIAFEYAMDHDLKGFLKICAQLGLIGFSISWPATENCPSNMQQTCQFIGQ